MAKLEGEGGGTIGSLWRQHGGGYYALLAVGTFVYLEAMSIAESYAEADGFRDFISNEILETILTLGFQTILNTFLASIWWVVWLDHMEFEQLLMFAGGGYVVWSVALAALLARRERKYRRELGLD